MGKKVRIPSRVVDVTEMGKLGGAATAAALTPEERSASARRAAEARWEGHKAKRPAAGRKKKEVSRGNLGF